MVADPAVHGVEGRLPPVLVMVFVAIMVFESEYTHLIRVMFFASPT